MSTCQPRSASVSLDGPAVAGWLVSGAAALEGARTEIDDINVFPVPDGDTGTNLALTVAAVADSLRPAAGGQSSETANAGQVAAAAAEAALQGARGNSGVILAAWLRGFAVGADAQPVLDGAALAAALRAASDGAISAVGRPLEGTILTVARAAGDAAETGSSGATALEVAAAALTAARTALANTTSQLPALRSAGVVDAGGAGLVVLLEALAGVPRVPTVQSGLPEPRPPASMESVPALGPAHRTVPAGEDRAYEVMYLLSAPAEAVPALESALSALGDSLVVSGRPGCYRVHVHVDDVGAAIEAALEAGRPSQITVTRFADLPDRAPPTVLPGGRAVVAMVPGAGVSALMAEAGATVVETFQSAGPSTVEVLAAIRGTGAGEVIVLPNDASAAAEAEAAVVDARAEGWSVGVVPTRSVMQGLAALAVHDPDRPFAEDVLAMTATARSTRSGEVVVAGHAALTSAGVCAAGQALGLIEGDVALISDSVDGAAHELLDRLLSGGGELVTLVTGAGAPAGLAERLTAHLRTARPAVEVEVHDCGQAGPPLLVGVE